MKDREVIIYWGSHYFTGKK